jgi:hypothetical protein
MKKLMLLFLGFIAWNVTHAQCEPDPSVPDTVFVNPLPYNAETRPEGGITDTACVNTYYELLYTFNIPDEYETEIAIVPINSVEIPAEDGIENLPASMDYVCNPPNCVFGALTQACILVFGTPEAGEEGEYDLTLDATIQSVLPLGISVPGDLEPGSHYYLNIKPEGSENCAMVDAQEVFAANFEMKNVPNPFTGWTQIMIDARIGGHYTFSVTDIFGKQLHQQTIQLFEGENLIPFDGSYLPSGFYTYSISNGKERVAQKMAVNRN